MGAPAYEPRHVIAEKPFGDRQVGERPIQNLYGISHSIELRRLEAEPVGKVGLLIADRANQQIAVKVEVEGRRTAVRVALTAPSGA